MVTLDPRAAAKFKCAGGIDFDLVGAGAQSPTVVKQSRGAEIEIGDLVLRDVPVLISGRSIAEGLQGVLPLSVFSSFLIRLDVPGKTLDLLPYPAAPPDRDAELQAILSNDLLFVRGTVNDRREGYFLLDTGASYNTVSKTVARELRLSDALAERVPMQAGTTEFDAPLVGSSVRFRFGPKKLGTGPAAAIDLSVSSRYHNLDIAGILGFPALSESVVVVNYRDGLVRIESK